MSATHRQQQCVEMRFMAVLGLLLDWAIKRVEYHEGKPWSKRLAEGCLLHIPHFQVPIPRNAFTLSVFFLDCSTLVGLQNASTSVLFSSFFFFLSPSFCLRVSSLPCLKEAALSGEQDPSLVRSDRARPTLHARPVGSPQGPQDAEYFSAGQRPAGVGRPRDFKGESLGSPRETSVVRPREPAAPETFPEKRVALGLVPTSIRQV